jgi:hypothetical protein
MVLTKRSRLKLNSSPDTTSKIISLIPTVEEKGSATVSVGHVN